MMLDSARRLKVCVRRSTVSICVVYVIRVAMQGHACINCPWHCSDCFPQFSLVCLTYHFHCRSHAQFIVELYMWWSKQNY